MSASNDNRNTWGMLIGAAVVALALILLIASVAHADEPQHAEGYAVGITSNWPTSCTPGSPYRVVNESTRIVQVWQETAAVNCTPGLTQWHATLQLPPGDWRVVWTIDARDGSADRHMTFFVRDRTVLKYRVWLPVVQ